MKRLRISVEGKTYEVEVELLDEGFSSPAPRSAAPTSSARVAAPVAAPAPAATPAPAPAPAGDGNGVVSPLAAVVVSADVAVGDTVTEGQTVMTLEAMKMNTIVAATQNGTVTAILVKAGDAVEEGQVLVTIA